MDTFKRQLAVIVLGKGEAKTRQRLYKERNSCLLQA